MKNPKEIEKLFNKAINRLPKQKTYVSELPSKKDRQQDRQEFQTALREKQASAIKKDIIKIHKEVKDDLKEMNFEAEVDYDNEKKKDEEEIKTAKDE
jgi:hypothetical protein